MKIDSEGWQEFKRLEAQEATAFIALLRCDCRNRLSQKGCVHAQYTAKCRAEWYAYHKVVGLVAPDAVE
jgi:hypothetical protein